MAVRILVTDGMDKGAIKELQDKGYEIVEKFYEPDELGKALRDFDAVVIRSATKIKEQQIDEAKGSRLKLIIRAGVGVDNIAVKYAEENGISVRNTPKASSNAVAELAIALLFSCARNISVAGATMREGKWEKKAYSKGFEVMGKTMGVIGYGRIGHMVGDKAQALGMNVLSMVHRNKPEGCECETMKFVSFDELLAKSDIIVLCAPSAGKPIIDAEALNKAKDGLVLINVSRGANIDEQSVIDALESGKLAAVGLDVWMKEKEPNMTLVNNPKVSSTPHIGAGTKEAQKRIGNEIISTITEFKF